MLLALTLFFCDFAGVMPHWIHALAHLQVVPAIMAGSVGILVFLFLLTLVFGRIYCSVVCPLGILQDVFSRLTRRGRKKNRKRRWFSFARPQTVLRYSILALCIVLMFFGSATLVAFLDPYSTFGRIAANLLRPAVVYGNNFAAWVAGRFGNYSLYNVTLHTVETWSLIFAAFALVVVAVMALLRGRLFCNTICPVGSLLGLISRFSLFRITLDKSRCTRCGLCERACKAQCINSQTQSVDGSRCVACFNCLDRCKGNGVRFEPIWWKKEETTSESRRAFLRTGATVAASLPVVSALAQDKTKIDETKLTPITPPGSQSIARFREKCTACHLCVTHCPQQILKPAALQYGFDYLFKPRMVFYEMAFCNYGCTVCSEICPNGAILPLTEDEKKITQVGIAKFRRGRCVVFTDRTSCGACSEHCPTQAVHMIDYEDGLTIPEVTPELCIGCGACESICPVRPIKAINVKANEVHQKAELPQDEEKKEIRQEDLDFGF